jgi:hypothetical protein
MCLFDKLKQMLGLGKKTEQSAPEAATPMQPEKPVQPQA